MSVSVCLSVSLSVCVCLSAVMSLELRVLSLPNSLCMLPMAVALSYLHIANCLVDVAARLRQRGSHVRSLGLGARRNTRCRQRTLWTTSCSQDLLGHSGRVEYS